MNAGGRIALPGNIFSSHKELGENDLNRQFGRRGWTWLEARESAAGSDPDGAVGLLGEGVEVAVVPSQPVAHVVVDPAGTVPHIYALLGARPQPPPGIEFEEIHQPIGA